MGCADCARREESEGEGMLVWVAVMNEVGGEAGVGDGCVGGGEADAPVGLAFESFFLHRDVVLEGDGLEAVDGADAVLTVGVLAAAAAPVEFAVEANVAAASAALSACCCTEPCCASLSLLLLDCAGAGCCLDCGLLGPAATICAAVLGVGPAVNVAAAVVAVAAVAVEG